MDSPENEIYRIRLLGNFAYIKGMKKDRRLEVVAKMAEKFLKLDRPVKAVPYNGARISASERKKIALRILFTESGKVLALNHKYQAIDRYHKPIGYPIPYPDPLESPDKDNQPQIIYPSITDKGELFILWYRRKSLLCYSVNQGLFSLIADK